MKFSSMWGMLTLLLTVSVVSAQPDACPQQVTNALMQVTEVCQGTERNQAPRDGLLIQTDDDDD